MESCVTYGSSTNKEDRGPFQITSVTLTKQNHSDFLTLFHMRGGGGGGDSYSLLQIVFFITSARDAAGPRHLVTFPQI